MRAFVLFLTLLITTSNGEKIPRFRDNFQRMNTGDKFWIQRKSYSSERDKCVYTEKLLLNQKDYIFTLNYLSGGQKTVITSHGKLHMYTEQGGARKSAMDVIETKGGGNNVTYTLQYWDDTDLCMVVTFEDKNSGYRQCELHTRGQIDRPLERCTPEYRKLCDPATYKEYIMRNLPCS
uniref:Lipocalin/cytosolic fatty-acid binding domain-containing protein n=1 Tax=Amblyomma maculatum TaxID=34609 RepID=G3MRH9_AMBMU